MGNKRHGHCGPCKRLVPKRLKAAAVLSVALPWAGWGLWIHSKFIANTDIKDIALHIPSVSFLGKVHSSVKTLDTLSAAWAIGNATHPLLGSKELGGCIEPCCIDELPIAGAAVDGVHVSPWNGHVAAFTQTWGDGSDGPITFGASLFNAHNLSSTFFLAPYLLDPQEDKPSSSQSEDKWDKWSLARSLLLEQGQHEVASHFHSHTDMRLMGAARLRREFELVRQRFDLEFPALRNRTLTMAWPSGPRDAKSRTVAREFYIAARDNQCEDLIGIPWDGLQEDNSWYDIPACPVQATSRSESLVAEAIGSRSWVIGHIHGLASCAYGTWWDTRMRKGKHTVEAIKNLATGKVMPCQHGYMPLPKKAFVDHAEHIVQARDTMDLWVPTFGEAVRYMKESRVVAPSAICVPTFDGACVIRISVPLLTNRSLPQNPVPIAVEFDCPAIGQLSKAFCDHPQYTPLNQSQSVAVSPCGGSHPVETVKVRGRRLIVRGILPGGPPVLLRRKKLEIYMQISFTTYTMLR